MAQQMAEPLIASQDTPLPIMNQDRIAIESIV